MKRWKLSSHSEYWSELIEFEAKLLPTLYDLPVTCQVLATHPFYPFRGPHDEQPRKLKALKRKKRLPREYRKHFEGYLIRRILREDNRTGALEKHKELTARLIQQYERLLIRMILERGILVEPFLRSCGKMVF